MLSGIKKGHNSVGSIYLEKFMLDERLYAKNLDLEQKKISREI